MLYRHIRDLQREEEQIVPLLKGGQPISQQQQEEEDNGSGYTSLDDEITLLGEDSEIDYTLHDKASLREEEQANRDTEEERDECQYTQEDTVQATIVEDLKGEETKGHYVVFPRLWWMDEVTLPRSFRLTLTWRAECHKMTKPKFSAHDFVHGQVQYGNFQFVMDGSEHPGRQKLESKLICVPAGPKTSSAAPKENVTYGAKHTDYMIENREPCLVE